jgi:hypothetical protein
MSDTGIVVIGGKEYLTVARRLRDFWHGHPDWSITTELQESGQIVRVVATIADETGRVRATGTAEEDRERGNINKTSAVENCETGAVGRALGIKGLIGSAVASAEEMQQALERQAELPLVEHNAVVREWLPSIMAIKKGIADNEYSAAVEAFREIPQDIMRVLWKAPSKGGIWLTEERAAMKSNEWNEASKAFHMATDEE